MNCVRNFALASVLLTLLLYGTAAPSGDEQKNQSIQTLFSSLGSDSALVTLETRAASDKVHAGSSIKAAVVMQIAPGWHVNAHVPTEDYLIGTDLKLELREGIIISDIRYPKAKRIKFEFADEPLDVYEGTAPVFLTLQISDKLAPGTYELRGKLTYQACNNQVCLPPADLDVAIPLLVAGKEETIAPINQDVFSAYIPASEEITPQPQNELAAVFESEGALAAFVAIFVIGLALNLTPCVYPMLSVTVSLFGTQTETRVGRVFAKAIVYVLGIATMYSVLGVVAALGGGLFGSWLQSPWVLGGIGVLLFALALSMFGLYQLRLPYWLTSKLGGTTATGIWGIYASGLVVGVFAAPCVGPPVIALLAVVGAKGDPIFGFWVFFTLSLGLGLPYLILGTFSGLLKKIPRSGPWLVWVERIFGVILVGAALFYVSLAALPKYTAYVIPLVLIAGGIYLGFLEPSGKERRILRRIQWTFGVVTIVLGLAVANNLRETGLSWEKYSDEKLEAARAQSRPVMIDFYADWCIPCLELDRRTFTSPQVIEAASGLVRLKVDLTRFDSPESEALRREYNIVGVPTIVFLKSDGEEASGARVVGYLPPEDFAQRIRNVAR
jgi:thiol:disulfide interchange protein DsbD